MKQDHAHGYDYGNAFIKNLGDDSLDTYKQAENNVDRLFDRLEQEVEEYSKSDCWNQDEERLRYILTAEKKITLARSGGFFLEFSLSPKLRKYEEAYQFLTSSDLPSYIEIHNLEVDTKEGVVKIQLSDRRD